MFDFPASPTVNQEFTPSGGPTYIWKTTHWMVKAPTPSAHTHVMADVTDLAAAMALKAPLASPGLTGTPTAPSAAGGTNSNQIATTNFVNGEVGTSTATGAYAAKASIVDADNLAGFDSAASNAKSKWTW